MPDHLGTEAVVAEEDVADSGDQNPCARRYILRIFRYRWTSGIDLTPTTTPADHRDGDHQRGDPSDHVHVGLLLSGLISAVSSGSISSGEKYR